MRAEVLKIKSLRIHLMMGAGKRFALGIAIDRYSLDLEFGPFWLSLEWWIKRAS